MINYFSAILNQLAPPATVDATDGNLLLLAMFIVGVFGACIGSFLNVVVHRLPRGESIAFPNSKCPSCSAAIKFYDNIPVLSYLILRGRCRNCGARISPRYPALELLTAALFALVCRHDGLTLALPFDLVFVSALIALVFIDAEHMILPNKITYPGAIFALLARIIVPYTFGVEWMMVGTTDPQRFRLYSVVNSLFGAVLGAGLLWLIGWLWKRLRGIEAMGLGDVKMMLMIGAFLGVALTGVTIFLGFISGSVVGVIVLAKRRERDMSMMLPFGIFLGLSAIVSLLYGEMILGWYLAQFM